MSIVTTETIEFTAQSVGINSLSPDGSLALAPDVEYRLREIMQEAIKCMRHSKRNLLTTEDVDSALRLRNVEPIYGFASADPLQFRRALGHKDLFYIDDKDVDFKDVIEAPLPKAPLESSVLCHWLAIEGVQPAIPENAPVEVKTLAALIIYQSIIIRAPSETKLPEQKDAGLPVDIRLPVKHVLSRELQLYFDKITELAVSRSDSVLFKEALVSLATDSGLHPLVPYFTCFVADEVSRGLSNFPLLFALMRLVWSLLQNPHLHVEPYLHQLMPSVVTCLVAKRLGNRLADNHWELRDFTATIVACICRRFSHVYNNLQTRLTKTLLHAFLDPKRAITQHYGAIQGLGALGPNVVRLLVVPNLETYLRLLEPEMVLEKQKNEMKRREAWRVYGALLCAAGQSIYDRLKMFPSMPSSPAGTIWKTNSRMIHSCPANKRKMPADQLEQPPLKKIGNDDGPLFPLEQPPLKKIGNDDGALFPLANNSSDMETDKGAAALGNSSAGFSSPKEISDSASEKRQRRGEPEKQILKTPALLNQAWEDDLDSGRLLILLFELFGESIFPFIPMPEMAFFL